MAVIAALEQWLDRERDQLALWLPVGLGSGTAAWFTIATRHGWIGFMLLTAAGALLFLAAFGTGRAGRAGAIFLLLAASGCGLAWWRAERIATPTLSKPVIASFSGRVDSVEWLAARGITRIAVIPDPGQSLPEKVRLNVDSKQGQIAIEPGQRIRMRARLMPPPGASLPGGYDFARLAWFRGLGATGRALGPIKVLAPGETDGFAQWIGRVRAKLTNHIHQSVAGSAGGIAASLVTGDQGAIAEADADALRTAGLAHLLSISGLHVGAVVAGAMLIVLRLLALSPALALRAPLPLVAAGVAALAGIIYTLIAGAEVPTIRSCIAAILVLIALAIGREAMTLRLVAAGALVILLLWPEALVGPSFQLSFAAVTVLVTFGELPWVRRFAARREGELWLTHTARNALLLLLTGLAIEIAIMPIGLYHFHKAGLYGCLANMIAIPLTTIVIMPVEALALLLDLGGLGSPLWLLAELSLNGLIGLARFFSSLPGATAALPTMPLTPFGLMAGAGLWLCLWRSRVRLIGLPVLISGIVWALATPSPDLLVTGDGKHLAVRGRSDGMYLLRPRAGDYVRDTIGNVSAQTDLDALDTLPSARCNADMCAVDTARGGRRWTILATRSPYFAPWRVMVRACAGADIVVSDRYLPRACSPLWLKIDRSFLNKTGGLMIYLSEMKVRTVKAPRDDHPWISPASYPQ